MVCILFSKRRWNHFFPNKCCFEFGVGILCVLGMWFQELRDAYCMVVNLLIWEHRLETEAGSKLTQLGLMARCRQIRQQQSFAGINLRSYIAPRKHQRNTFFCTTVLFLVVLKQWFHRWSYRAARIEKNALYQHQHGNLQVKNPASPKFCACFFLIFEWQNSQVVQSRPQCQKL